MTIRAVGITRFGGPDVLTIVNRPMPVPQSGEVRIRVAAASVNPTDVWMREGRSAKALREIPPPWTPGMDVAGTIDLVGPDVDFTVGEAVIAIVVPLRPLGGAQAEFVVVPACSVARVPPGLSLTAAATIPLNALTARLALDRLDLEPGASLAITGAPGALGGYAIQLAKMDGLTVVAAGCAADAQLLTDLGADVVVERGREVRMTRDAIPGGVDAAIDCAVVGKEILSAIRDDGQLASVRAWRDPSERGIVIRPIWITDYITNAPALRRLAGLAGEGRLALRVAHKVAPERVADAHRLLEAGGLRGRCVISFE